MILKLKRVFCVERLFKLSRQVAELIMENLLFPETCDFSRLSLSNIGEIIEQIV